MGGALVSKSRQEQPAVVMEQPAESPQDSASGAGGGACASLEQLNIETPRIPGDVALSGVLPEAAVSQLAGKYRSWLWIGEDGHEAYHEGLLKAREGLETRSIHWAKPTPDDRKVAAIMEAMDGMPRPMMIQCITGTRASAALALWLVKKGGYSTASLAQLAQDDDLKVFTRCTVCGPMTEWLMAQMPEKDEAGKLSLGTSGGLMFFQLFDGPTSTFTYLLACEASKKCVLIDPVLEQIDRDLALVSELGLELTHVLNTHCHADHVTSGGAIRKRLPDVKTVISKASGAKADVHVAEGDKVNVGPNMALEVIATPGHTDGCVTYLLREPRMMVFTGDALLIRGCGRTDFQQGNAGMLYDMVRSKIFSLPKDTIVYPGHDYKGRTVSTVGEEAEFNPRLTKSRDEFVEVMKNLGLPYPKRIDVAVPANLVCGVQD